MRKPTTPKAELDINLVLTVSPEEAAHLVADLKMAGFGRITSSSAKIVNQIEPVLKQIPSPAV